MRKLFRKHKHTHYILAGNNGGVGNVTGNSDFYAAGGNHYAQYQNYAAGYSYAQQPIQPIQSK